MLRLICCPAAVFTVDEFGHWVLYDNYIPTSATLYYASQTHCDWLAENNQSAASGCLPSVLLPAGSG